MTARLGEGPGEGSGVVVMLTEVGDTKGGEEEAGSDVAAAAGERSGVDSREFE